ncbi:MAG: zf-HC2 domain-containing protein [Candidatus Promineofilum sp.]|nr:zf-HC2 domain-containing protein [Promineifilum sp.]
MEHEERYYLMMMSALDDELPAAEHDELTAHLSVCPDCGREWRALLAIDMLFRQTPLLMPAVDFATRTLALLPDRRVRVRALGALYGLLLLCGLVPLVLVVFLSARYAPILSQPALLGRVWLSLVEAGRVGATVVNALFAGAGRFVIEQPAVVGWLIVLAGFVFLWGGVFQRLLAQPAAVESRN